MTTDLLEQRGDRRLIKAEVRLGPPKPIHLLIGGAIGVPLGLGIVMQPHALLLGIGGIAFVVYFAGATVIAMTRLRRFNGENNAALGALGRGELAKAHEVFVRWAPRQPPIISATARHNLGWTLMLEQRLEDAVTILEDTAEHYKRPLTRTGLLPTTLIDTTLCHALLGNLDQADIWFAKSQLPVKPTPHPSFPGMVALTRGIIDCRRGRTAEARVSLEHGWNEHEATLTGETLRMMRVVRAFACATEDGPRSQGLVERILGDMKPRYEGEFGFLGGAWPEMAVFLAAHHLADAP